MFTPGPCARSLKVGPGQADGLHSNMTKYLKDIIVLLSQVSAAVIELCREFVVAVIAQGPTEYCELGYSLPG